MKIEKISDSQIRCTLTREDLNTRNIRLSELAYGSEKARRLFQDMMQEAHIEVGFETGNAPLMIEAIPTSSESIILMITKVEDPEELDARFSKFTQSRGDSLLSDRLSSIGADEILDLLSKIYDSGNQSDASESEDRKTLSPAGNHAVSAGEKKEPEKPVSLTEIFRFDTLDEVIRAAHGLNHFYTGRNTLYRRDDFYLLVVHQSGSRPENFNKVCNILSEYGTGGICPPASEAFLREHGEILIRNSALQKLETL